jgi:hypothetical protein
MRMRMRMRMAALGLGLTSVTFELEDTDNNTVGHTSGGFCCVPGSHRVGGGPPPSWVSLAALGWRCLHDYARPPLFFSIWRTTNGMYTG